MSNKQSHKSWEEIWSEYPPLVDYCGSLADFVQSAFKNDRIPWVVLECQNLSRLLIQNVAGILGRQMHAVVIVPGTQIEDIQKLQFCELSDRPEYRFEHGLGAVKMKGQLDLIGYTNVSKVWGQGEYSVVGDIVTVWPNGTSTPYRIELENDRISLIHKIDPESRRSVGEVERLVIHDMNLSTKGDIYEGSSKASLYETVVAGDYNNTHPKPVVFSEIYPFADEIPDKVEVMPLDLRRVVWNTEKHSAYARLDYDVWIVAEDPARLKVPEVLRGAAVLEGDLHESFVSQKMNLIVYAGSEIEGAVKIKSSMGGGRYGALLLDKIKPGEYVVHEDHGIARFAGLKIRDDSGSQKRYLELEYLGDDRLYVPMQAVHKVTRYIGVGDRKPLLTGLTGGSWRRITNRVKKSIKSIAGELLRLYAAREISRIDPLGCEIGKVLEFENEFEFKETEDQIRAIEDIKQDLSSDRPMDRLIVGDVGYGKTEVAMRAAFIAVCAGRQVAVLAPTTVLVEQHYHVFCRRIEKFGVKVGVLSRFGDRTQRSGTIDRLESGGLDVVVGTHRLLSEDVHFQNLGLLIVDEEQKFGVAQKEKLKEKKVDVHVLSLSATPIPRTLNMALTGVRDISIVATPPEGRQPTKNHVQRFDWSTIEKAVRLEAKRGGQVYFVYNRVRTIDTMCHKLGELMPDVRFVVGHGQMSPADLARVMREFNSGKYDVLVCSTIIENGLDMPNVNTLIVDRAEMLGLAQLYQLRGRIGRSTRQAYAYFLYHGKQERNLRERARKRLGAVRELEDLGAGFNLAQRDLEIRGAGDFLGKQQHGNVSAVGFNLYSLLLARAIDEMRGV